MGPVAGPGDDDPYDIDTTQDPAKASDSADATEGVVEEVTGFTLPEDDG